MASLLSEQNSFTPPGLATATTRWDLGGDGQIYRHDAAGRLLSSEASERAATAVGNNSVPAPAGLEAIATGFAFDYTPTDHMTLQAEKQAGVLTRETLLPADGSGRNRPAFANGKALTWDANGNLIAKGPVRFAYDFHNRLVRVTEDGVGELASYDYDALNRRISRAVAGEEHPTVWSGWQAIEEYGENGLAARRVYGLGLDEIVRAEVDLDDNGSVETTQRPIYDRIGNLVVLADEAGKPVERYTYKPYSPAKTAADLTPPQLMQIRRSEFGAIEFDSSEALSGEALREQLEAGPPGSAINLTINGQPVSVSPGNLRPQGLAAPVLPASSPDASLAVFDAGTGPHATLTQREIPGRESGRTWTLTFDEPVPAGANVTLTFHPAGIQDDFANPLEALVTRTFIWPDNAAVLLDTAPPEVERISATFGGVEILFSEPVVSATLPPGVTVDGQTLTWAAAGSEYRYRATITLPPGPHQVQVNTQLHDLAGTAPAAAANFSFSIPAAGGTIAYEKPDPDEIDASAAKNPYGFQGLPRDPETGFLYARNRYFDPEIGRFVTADPLGFVDGPSEYAFASNNPSDREDGLGLDDAYFLSYEERRQLLSDQIESDRHWRIRCAAEPMLRQCQSLLGQFSSTLFGDTQVVATPIFGSEYYSGRSVLYVNGILNSNIYQTIEASRELARYTQRPVRAIWNPSSNFLMDSLQVFLVNKPGVLDTSTLRVALQIRKMVDDANGEAVEVYAHSQGAAIVSTALSFLTHSERSRVRLTTFGGAAETYPEGLLSIRHVINGRPDPVPLFLGALFSGNTEFIYFQTDVLSHGIGDYLEALEAREGVVNQAKPLLRRP